MPGDIYSALTGQLPTDQESQQALINALRGKSMMGQIGALSGDSVLAPFGQNLMRSSDQEAENIGSQFERQQGLKQSAAMQAAQIAHMGVEEGQQRSVLEETHRKNIQEAQRYAHEYGYQVDKNGDPIVDASGQPGRDPAFENEAQAIAHYERAPYNTRNANPRAINMMSRAEEISHGENRQYDDTMYNAKNSYEKSLASGPVSQMLIRGGTAVQHLGVLKDATLNLHNQQLPVWNVIKNTALQWAGKPNITDFEGIKKQVADEVGSFAIGMGKPGGGVYDRREIENEVASQKSEASLLSLIQRWTDLMKGRADNIRQGYENAVPDFPGTPHRRKEFGEYLTPEAREGLGIKLEKEQRDRFTGFSSRPIEDQSATPDNPRGQLGRPPNPPGQPSDLIPAQ